MVNAIPGFNNLIREQVEAIKAREEAALPFGSKKTSSKDIGYGIPPRTSSVEVDSQHLEHMRVTPIPPTLRRK